MHQEAVQAQQFGVQHLVRLACFQDQFARHGDAGGLAAAGRIDERPDLDERRLSARLNASFSAMASVATAVNCRIQSLRNRPPLANSSPPAILPLMAKT